MGPHEYKTGCRGDLCVGAAILADEDKSRAAIGYIQDDGGALPGPDWLHSDDEKLTDRLVEILKPQLWSDFCSRQAETQLFGARVDVCQQRSVGPKAQFGCRHREKLYARCRGAHGKRRPRENFASRVSDATTCRIQSVTEGEEVCKRPDPDRLPRRDIDGGCDRDLRPIRARLLELQVIPQDVSRRALSHSFARKQESACDAKDGNNENATMVPSRRMTLNGMATDFPASCSAHNGPLLRKCSALETIRNYHFHMVGAVTADKPSFL
jgi:hypothetical protein